MKTSRKKLHLAQAAIAQGEIQSSTIPAASVPGQAALVGAPVAFLFPGQGAQSPGMLRELAVIFPRSARRSRSLTAGSSPPGAGLLAR